MYPSTDLLNGFRSRRPWPGAGLVLEPCCREQPQGGAPWFSGPVVVCFINRNHQRWDFQIMHWILKRKRNGTIFVSFKDPSHCDDPLGGSGAAEFEGLKMFFEASQLWCLEMGNHFLTPKKDQFRVQGWGKMGWNDTNLARLISHVFFIGCFSLSN